MSPINNLIRKIWGLDSQNIQTLCHSLCICDGQHRKPDTGGTHVYRFLRKLIHLEGTWSRHFPDKRSHMNDLFRRLKVVQRIFREHFASIYRQGTIATHSFQAGSPNARSRRFRVWVSITPTMKDIRAYPSPVQHRELLSLEFHERLAAPFRNTAGNNASNTMANCASVRIRNYDIF